MAGLGRRGKVWSAVVRQGTARLRSARLVRLGTALPGETGKGLARQGKDRQARLGKAV
jgi:hypothetical protein